MSYFEVLKQQSTERRLAAAKLLARNSLPPEERMAELDRQATALAVRYAPTLAKVTLLREVSEAEGSYYSLVELGNDEQGYRYFGEIRRGGEVRKSVRDFTVMEFFSEPSGPYSEESLGTTSFTQSFGSEGARVNLILSDGTSQWRIRPYEGRPTIQDREAVFDYAEATVAELEPMADMVWSAANNPQLNPDLAEKLAAMQQA